MLTLSTPTSQSEKVIVNEFTDLSIRSENYYEKRKVSVVGYKFMLVSVCGCKKKEKCNMQMLLSIFEFPFIHSILHRIHMLTK
jgi:hypothetical protein